MNDMKNELYVELLRTPEVSIVDVSVGKKRVDIGCESYLAERICLHCLSHCQKVNQILEHEDQDLLLSGREVKVHLLLLLRAMVEWHRQKNQQPD